MSAITAMPAHPNPHAYLPVGYIGSHGIDDAHHLVPGHARILNARDGASDREHVAVAYTAGLHFDAHLALFWFWNVALDDLKIGVGLGDLDDFHSRHKGLPLKCAWLILASGNELMVPDRSR
jgi:hypothetical protein